MLIDLTSIDEDGKNYNFDESSDEMMGAFSDLIGEKPFKIDLNISPMGNTYLVTGNFNSEYPEMCSLCGHEIEVPLHNRINEIVVIEKQRPRNTQVSQSQQNFNSDGPSVTYVNEPTLNLKEFIHELMAASFDFYPRCSDQEKCQQQQSLQKYEDQTKKAGHPGFEALKNLKIKH